MTLLKSLAIGMGLGLSLVALGADAKSTITAEYKKIDSLVFAKKMAPVKAYLEAKTTKDFLYHDNRLGNQTLDQFLTQMDASMKQMGKITETKSTLKGWKVTPKVVMVTTSMKLSFLVTGPDKTTHKISGVEVSNDTWKKVGSSWKLASIKETSESMTMDGKKINQGSPAAN